MNIFSIAILLNTCQIGNFYSIWYFETKFFDRLELCGVFVATLLSSCSGYIQCTVVILSNEKLKDLFYHGRVFEVISIVFIEHSGISGCYLLLRIIQHPIIFNLFRMQQNNLCKKSEWRWRSVWTSFEFFDELKIFLNLHLEFLFFVYQNGFLSTLALWNFTHCVQVA